MIQCVFCILSKSFFLWWKRFPLRHQTGHTTVALDVGIGFNFQPSKWHVLPFGKQTWMLKKLVDDVPNKENGEFFQFFHVCPKDKSIDIDKNSGRIGTNSFWLPGPGTRRLPLEVNIAWRRRWPFTYNLRQSMSSLDEIISYNTTSRTSIYCLVVFNLKKKKNMFCFFFPRFATSTNSGPGFEWKNTATGGSETPSVGDRRRLKSCWNPNGFRKVTFCFKKLRERESWEVQVIRRQKRPCYIKPELHRQNRCCCLRPMKNRRWVAGWKPVEKWQGHMIRRWVKRIERFPTFGWQTLSPEMFLFCNHWSRQRWFGAKLRLKMIILHDSSGFWSPSETLIKRKSCKTRSHIAFGYIVDHFLRLDP